MTAIESHGEFTWVRPGGSLAGVACGGGDKPAGAPAEHHDLSWHFTCIFFLNVLLLACIAFGKTVHGELWMRKE